MCVVVAAQVAGVQRLLRGQNRPGCWWVGKVGIVGVGGRVVFVESETAEAVGIAVVGVQRQGRPFRVWVVPEAEVVPGPEVDIVPEPGSVPGLEAVLELEPELSDLAGRVQWRVLA
jgi:hypothetical protein